MVCRSRDVSPTGHVTSIPSRFVPLTSRHVSPTARHVSSTSPTKHTGGFIRRSLGPDRLVPGYPTRWSGSIGHVSTGHRVARA
eukprot:1292009-Rhodomonas_salina.1